MIGYVLILLVLFYFLNRVFNIRNLFNPFVFVIIYHFIFFYLALFYKDIYKHVEISRFTIFIINYSFLSIFLGGIVSRYCFQKIGTSYTRFPEVEINFSFRNKNVIVGLLFILVGVFLTFKFIFSSGGFVIFADDVENSRIAARKGKGLISQLALNLFTYGLLVVLMVKRRKPFKYILVFVVAFFVFSFGNRGPVLFLLVFALYVIQIVNKFQFSLKKMALIGFSLFSLMVLFGAIRTNHPAELIELFKFRFAWRPFVNIQNFQYVIDYFPSKHDFLLGKTYLVDFSMILPGSNPNSGTYLKELMGFSFDGGSITPSYLGISYVNFGIIGLIFSPFLLGFVSNTVYEYYIRNINLRKPEAIILLLLISFNFAAIVVSGFMTVLVQNMIVILVVHFTYMVLTRLIVVISNFTKKIE